MQVNTYLMFGGNCEEAFKFYETLLGGTVTQSMRMGDAPDNQTNAETRDLIMHISMTVANQVLMGSDCPPQHPYEGCKGMQVSLNVDTIAEADRLFAALSEGGTVTMPIQKTFWSPRFGMTVDRFGVPWMVNCDGEAGS